jgi:cephalosporin hydroxylase
MQVFDRQEMVTRATRLAKRIANFVRPKPRTIPLGVEEVLASSAGRELVERFIEFYYRSGTAPSMSYRGIEILKNPCDIWMAVELFQTVRPTVVVETGTHHGGSAVYYGDALKMLGIPSAVITIDMNPKWSVDPQVHGVTSVVGYSTDKNVVATVRTLVERRQQERPGNVMVFLDSDLSKDNVLQELRLYSALVTAGSYLVVEDTHVNGHPSFASHGPGPWEAVDAFLAGNQEFYADRSCERFLLTYNPRGWLRRR